MLLTEVAGKAPEADAAGPDAAGRHSRTPCSRAAGSSQSASSAAFKLEAASRGTPACSAITAVPAACPTPQHRDHAQGLRRASPQVKRVLPPAGPPPGAGVQRGPQRPHPEPLRGRGQLNRPLDQPPVQVTLDQPGPERDQGPLGKRRLLRAQAVQHQRTAQAAERHVRADRLSEWQRVRPSGNACPAYSLTAFPATVRLLPGSWVTSIRRACAFGAAGMVTRRTPLA